MFCFHCGRRSEDCPGGIWRGGRNGAEGCCVYCARACLRALDPFNTVGSVEPLRLLPRLRVTTEPPEAA